MQPTRRFADRAQEYARFRPDYPAEAIDAILDSIGDPAHLVVADLGAGTGIASRQLARRGVRVIAIEPNGPMRGSAAPEAGIEWREGSAEDTGLPDQSVMLATAFQAFHWFDPEPALREMHRILVPDGRLALVWNQRDPDDPLTAAYSRIVRALSDQHPAEERPNVTDPLFASSLFAGVRHRSFAHGQDLSLEGLLGRAASVSYLPKEGPRHEELTERLLELHRDWGDSHGMVRLAYRTEVFLATRA